MTTVDIESHRRTEMIDVTGKVRRVIGASGVRSGIAVIFVPHTTAAVTINENADPDVTRDMMMEIDRIVPFEDGYRHNEGNSAAHIKSTLVGASETVIVENGEPLLGTWQGIYFYEFDGPRRRKLHIKVIGA